MANSKFPLNGRYTTLGDLVHEYAISSVWPSNISESEGWEVSAETANQPFTQLIFNSIGDNEYEAEHPYELVWFGNVYAQDIYDPGTKMRKLVQLDDTSVYGFDRYIIASQISNAPEIFTEGIPFRFIIPDKITHENLNNGDDQSRYFYNYKLDNGEATVIYALLGIIDILYQRKYWETSSSESEPTFEDKSKRLREFLFGEKNTPGIIHAPKEGGGTLTLYSLFYDDYWYLDTEDPYNPDGPIIEKDNQERIFVKNDVYDRLGSYYWTELHIQYNNYTTSKNLSIIPTVNTRTVQDQNVISGIVYKNLKELIYYTVNGTYEEYKTNENSPVKDQFDTENIRKSYLTSSDYTKLYFYCYWFLTTLRFHRSYITGCQFIKISNVTYLPNQPVLRCDLNLARMIEDFTILDAVHTPSSMLPAGQITENTAITINISYSAKYANISKRTESSFELTLTFKQINQIKNNTDGDNMWIRFYTPDDTREPDLNNSIFDGDAYGSTYFPTIESAKNWSLKTIKWPIFNSGTNTSTNLEINKSQFDAAKNDVNFENGNCYESTYNLKSYGRHMTTSGVLNRIQNYINNAEFDPETSYAPGGMIRFHSSYTLINPQQAQASAYYIDVPLIRRKNYYYTKTYAPATDVTASDNIEVNMYFEPAYRNTDPHKAASSVAMNMVLYDANDTLPNDIETLEQLFLNNIDPSNDLYYYGLTSDENTYYLTIKSRAGKMEYYVSGDSLFIPTPGTNTNDFIHFTNIHVDKFFTAGEQWYTNAESNFISGRNDINYSQSSLTQTETQSELNLNTTLDPGSFTYYRMRFGEVDDNEILNNNYIYFRVNNYNTNLSNSFTARYLKPIDCSMGTRVPGISALGTNSDVLLEKTNLCFITYHKDDFDKSNISYNKLAFYLSGAEKKIYYVKNNTNSDKDIILKPSAISYKEDNIDKYIYTTMNTAPQSGTPLYIAYTYKSIMRYYDEYLILRYIFTDSNNADNVTDNNIFKPIKIDTKNIYMHSACKLYMSLMPIYMFCFISTQNPDEVIEIKLNKLYYKTGNDTEKEFAYTPSVDPDVNEQQVLPYMVTSFIKDTFVYMKPDSVTVKIQDGNNIVEMNLGDSRLYLNYTVGVQYDTVNITGTVAYGPTASHSFNNNDATDSGVPRTNNINYICYDITSSNSLWKVFRGSDKINTQQGGGLNFIHVNIHPK